MVFRQLVETWKKGNLYSQALDELKGMFDLDIRMFEKACEALFKGEKNAFNVHSKDDKVNEHEMNIRRKILEHLSINPRQDTTASLILITIVKDLERLGDHAKNIFELHNLYKKPLEGTNYVYKLIKIQERIMNMFKMTYDAFFNADKEKGKDVMDLYLELEKDADYIFTHVFDEKKMPTQKAIVCVMLARYFRRAGAHLKNVARTVVNPFDKIHEV